MCLAKKGHGSSGPADQLSKGQPRGDNVALNVAGEEWEAQMLGLEGNTVVPDKPARRGGVLTSRQRLRVGSNMPK